MNLSSCDEITNQRMLDQSNEIRDCLSTIHNEKGCENYEGDYDRVGWPSVLKICMKMLNKILLDRNVYVRDNR